MATLTGEDRARMDAAERTVLHLVDAAQWQLSGANPVNWFGLTGTQEQLLGVVNHAARLFAEWSSSGRRWVEQGRNKVGEPYSLDAWLRTGKDLASQLRDVTGNAFDASLFAPVLGAMPGVGGVLVDVADRAHEEQAERVADVLQGGRDAVEAGREFFEDLPDLGPSVPLWVKVAGGALVGAVVLGSAGYFVRGVR